MKYFLVNYNNQNFEKEIPFYGVWYGVKKQCSTINFKIRGYCVAICSDEGVTWSQNPSWQELDWPVNPAYPLSCNIKEYNTLEELMQEKTELFL